MVSFASRMPSRAPRRRVGALPILALLLAASLLPLAQAAEDDVLFVRPHRLQRIQADPWADGVWLATEAGLFFRGNGGLRHYAYADGLPSTMVNDVAPAASQVWIGTGSGLAVLDKSNSAIARARLGATAFEASVRTVHLEAATTWVGTDDAGLYRVDAATLATTAVPNPINGSAFRHPIYGIAAVGSWLYISATGYGLVEWDRATGTAKLYDDVYNQAKPYYGRILGDADDVWIGSDGDGVLRLDRATGRLTEHASPSSVNALTVYQPLKVGRTVWFPTHVGVSRYDGATGDWSDWGDVPYGKMAESANDLALVDGTLYAATAYGHIARFDPGLSRWIEEPWWDWSRGINHNVILSCAGDGDRLAFGTGGGGLQFLDPSSGTWSKAGLEPGDQGKPNGISIEAVARTEGKRFLGHENGITEIDVASGEYENYLVASGAAYRGRNLVKDVKVDGEHVWAGTHASEQPRLRKSDPVLWNPGRLARLDPVDHDLRLYGREAGLSDENVTRVLPDGGVVWVGTKAGGLDVLDKATERITHVWPVSGGATVNDLAVTPDSVWIAASGAGLVRLDRATGQVHAISGLQGATVQSLLLDGTTLWVGTLFDGLHALDTATMAVQSYRTGAPVDYLAFCLVLQDGILHLGTGWGVERFDTLARRFLPQVGPVTGAFAGAPGKPQLRITDLDVAQGLLHVGGTTSSTPAGSAVEVRLDQGPWQPASGLTAWGVDVAAPVTAVTVTARLLGPAGELLAQAAHAWNPSGDSAAAAATGQPRVRHDPVQRAAVGEPLRFEVRVVDDAPGLGGIIRLQRPAGGQEELPLRFSGGLGVAEAAPLVTGGTAFYEVQMTWDGGAWSLPEPFTGHGARYAIDVTDRGGAAVAEIDGPERVRLLPGEATPVEFVVRNTGTRTALLNVTLTGPSAAWATNLPDTVVVAAAASEVLRFDVVAPVAAKAGTYRLEVQLALLADGGATTLRSMQLDIADINGDVPGASLGVSGDTSRPPAGAPLDAWVPLAALALVALARRRR
jgi:hypothetical protein